MPDPKNDTRTVDELVNTALCDTDEEAAWDSVCALHWRGTGEVLQRAEILCASQCVRERRLGVDILGQLGVPERTFPLECSRLLRGMLRQEEHVEVLQAALVGLSHQHDEKTVETVARFSTHPDTEVRHAVVLALTGHETAFAIECLISLSTDPDANVRDWATFALGTQCELDSTEIQTRSTIRKPKKQSDETWQT